MQFQIYTTKEGDRWDLIAYEKYGDVNKMNILISANPFVPITSTLAAGIQLKIPVIEETTETLEGLPFWLQ